MESSRHVHLSYICHDLEIHQARNDVRQTQGNPGGFMLALLGMISLVSGTEGE